jgi:exopolysaccharide production protein ExoZ
MSLQTAPLAAGQTDPDETPPANRMEVEMVSTLPCSESVQTSRASIKEVLAIQYLRGFAAILVIVQHVFTLNELNGYTDFKLGNYGVSIFFVISGYVMWITTYGKNVRPIEFWRRRIIRIVPLYWICIAALISIYLLAPSVLKSTTITFENAIKSFLFIPHYHLNFSGRIYPILVPGWSLNYEMFFYLLFGLSLFCKSTLNRVFWLSGVLFGLVLTGAIAHPSSALAVTYTSAYLFLFAAGVWLAVFERKGFVPWVVTGCAIILVCVAFFKQQTAIFYLWSCLIVAAALALEPLARLRPSPLLLLIGDASYAIYLTHPFTVRIPELIWRKGGLFGNSIVLDSSYVVIAVSFAIIAGTFLHLYIERPLLAFFGHLTIAAKEYGNRPVMEIPK